MTDSLGTSHKSRESASDTTAPEAHGWRWAAGAALAGIALVAVGYVALHLTPNWFEQQVCRSPHKTPTCLTGKDHAEDRHDITTGTLGVFALALSVLGATYTALTFALNRRTAQYTHDREV